MIRYEPNERLPLPLAIGFGLQQVILNIAAITLIPVIVVRSAGGDDIYLSWAVFAALIVSGVTSTLQALRLGRIGAGYPLLMGTSGAFMAVCITALVEGGPAVLATLILISALLQFAISMQLVWLRRLITPTVAGTVSMLIAVTVMPVVFRLLEDVPETASPVAGPISAAVTLLSFVFLSIRVSHSWRLWVPPIGLVLGISVAGFFGIYDFEKVLEADWIGFPHEGWPGIDLHFGVEFWALLPAFVLVTLIGVIETIGDTVVVQELSWRKSRPTNFREVQGAVYADGVGNLLSGIAGTVPNTTYASSISLVALTGIAARGVGIWMGLVLVLIAFMPKVAAFLLAIPGPVVAAYMLILLALLFVFGLDILLKDGLDHRKSLVVGVSFWVGVGFQNQVVFADLMPEWLALMLHNGMTSGGFMAIILTAFLHFVGMPRRRIKIRLDASAIPEIDAFLSKFAARRGWAEEAIARLRSAGEEALLCLIAQDAQSEDQKAGRRQLSLTVYGDEQAMELEFVAASGKENLENLMALLPQREGMPAESNISLQLLRHYASSVRHQQYHDTDILMVHVDREYAPPG